MATAIQIPEFCFVALIGPSGSGKSTFARKHFLETAVLSSDYFRGLVSDDENSQAATNDAFDGLYYLAGKRLANAKLTVIDATNVQKTARAPIVAMARKYHCLPIAIVLNVPANVCEERNAQRPNRQFGPRVVRQQLAQLRQSLRQLKKEGFRGVFVLNSPEEVDAATISRQKLWNDLRHESGPFDVIGDVHGCREELENLLTKLGYAAPPARGAKAGSWTHPQGRRAIFLGDLVDRGPDSPGVLRIAMSMVKAGTAFCVPGNHDVKLQRKLSGKEVRLTHGLAQTVEQLEVETEGFRSRVSDFLRGLVSHYVLDKGRLVVAHAGLKETYQGRASGTVREFALYGETTGETDEYGLPVRLPWAEDYRGSALVAYGHTPVPEPVWLNRTVNIDTGCVFGGSLSALRYPEKEIVSVPARKTYYEPIKPIHSPRLDATQVSTQQAYDDLLDLQDVVGKRLVETRLRGKVTISQENSTAALEVMSRFATNPKWLIYLPPTMSPSETSESDGCLEHPIETFAYYRGQGVSEVICEEKHMGSRAVIVVCQSEVTARERFGVKEEGRGACFTRTGRRFFGDARLEHDLLDRLAAGIAGAGLWDSLETGWLCLDCELMPWSIKARDLIVQQYASTGAAAENSLQAAWELAADAASRGVDLGVLPEHLAERRGLAARYRQAYRNYCWTVSGLEGVRLAPFHLLATESGVHVDKSHAWHMSQLQSLCDAGGPTLQMTNHRPVDLTDPASEKEAVEWWDELTASGGEGMVVKPMEFITKGKRGLVQPALKCRGREYLRIIYGPEYSLPENLIRLRRRSLARKRSLSLREFALGVEALERFVRREPLRRVHECVFGVLALESEAVDPRL